MSISYTGPYKKGEIKKVVLAYSGGLDTSVILKWLQTTYGCEVVTFTADLGQGEELGPARKKAEMLGIIGGGAVVADDEVIHQRAGRHLQVLVLIFPLEIALWHARLGPDREHCLAVLRPAGKRGAFHNRLDEPVDSGWVLAGESVRHQQSAHGAEARH